MAHAVLGKLAVEECCPFANMFLERMRKNIRVFKEDNLSDQIGLILFRPNRISSPYIWRIILAVNLVEVAKAAKVITHFSRSKLFALSIDNSEASSIFSWFLMNRLKHYSFVPC